MKISDRMHNSSAHLIFTVRVAADGLTLVHLLVPPQVRDDAEVPSTALHIARKWLLACVAVHVRLKRRWPGEAFVADSALVLLLRVGAHLRREVAHHRL